MKKFLSRIPAGSCFYSPKLAKELEKIGMITRDGARRFIPANGRFGCIVDGFYVEFINTKNDENTQFVDMFRRSYKNN